MTVVTTGRCGDSGADRSCPIISVHHVSRVSSHATSHVPQRWIINNEDHSASLARDGTGHRACKTGHRAAKLNLKPERRTPDVTLKLTRTRPRARSVDSSLFLLSSLKFLNPVSESGSPPPHHKLESPRTHPLVESRSLALSVCLCVALSCF